MGESLNLLIIPLLGGFTFVMLSKIFRHKILRHDGQFLFFLSASFGLFFLVLSYPITLLIAYLFPIAKDGWLSLFPFKYSGTALGSFVLALICAIPFKFMSREAVKDYIIRDENDAIETLLWNAMNNAFMVCITLDNDKVYVGFVSNMFFSDFRSTKSIGIIPSLSGFREENRKTICFTNYYEDLIEEVDKNPKKYTIDKNYISVSVPLSRVVSISYFDPAIHLYNEKEQKKGPHDPQTISQYELAF